ncbi:Na+/H+ antiporter subunit E [Bacillus piscicola]|uniref:Na+/H+ antiporter subunit E n=1 Tax=Bacillus piscicola TaxID=1632684 RepID=UPI001F091196|nr:Na+/H+ antiporter subunit E [Bacillus piscicola]
MAFQLIINLLIAFTWMFLNNAWSFGSFISGFIIGIGILYVLKGSQRFYLKGVAAIIKLLLIFLKELLMSTLEVAKLVLKPSLDIQPGIFAMDIDLKEDWEITVLSSLITLTPGTLVVDISPDNKTLYIHAIDLPDAEEARRDIDHSFVKAIKEVTR